MQQHPPLGMNEDTGIVVVASHDREILDVVVVLLFAPMIADLVEIRSSCVDAEIGELPVIAKRFPVVFGCVLIDSAAGKYQRLPRWSEFDE